MKRQQNVAHVCCIHTYRHISIGGTAKLSCTMLGKHVLVIDVLIANVYSCYLILSSVKEVTFSCCSFVCLLAGLCKNCSADFRIIRWKGGTWASEVPTRVWWQSRSGYVRVGVIIRVIYLGLVFRVSPGSIVMAVGRVIRCNAAYVLPGMSSIVIAQFTITINSNVCAHIWVLNTLMKESYA